jgi:hypothetical protein
MWKKIVENIKILLFPKKKPEEKKEIKNIDEGFFKNTFYKQLLYYLWDKNNQEIAERIYYRMYAFDPYIKAGINIIINYVKSFKIEYTHNNEAIKTQIENFLNKIQFNTLIEDFFKTYLILGYACYFIDKNQEIKFIKYRAKDIKEIKKDYIIFKNNTQYKTDNFLVLKNFEESEFGISPLLSIIPYADNNFYILDNLRFSSLRFLNPAIMIKYKGNTISQLTHELYLEELKKLKYEDTDKLPVITLPDSLNLDFFKPSELYKEFLEYQSTYLDIVLMNLLLPSGLFTQGGSYAKALVLENIIENYALSLLKNFIEQFKEKVIKYYFALNFQEEFYKDEIGDFVIYVPPTTKNK